MIIYLFRHGEAETGADADAQRQLTDRGNAQARKVVREFLMRAPALDKLLVSPLVRARQTAALLQEQLPSLPVHASSLLVPDADPQNMAAALQNAGEQIMLVGHNPHLSRLRSWLLHGDRVADRSLATAELVAIDTEAALPGCGLELYSIRPSEVS